MFSCLYWKRKHMGICSMCVQYVCETSLLQFTEKKTGGWGRGSSLKVAFFLFRQQTIVWMGPFTGYVLTSSGDACVVLNISVCAKEPLKQGDKQTKGGGDHQRIQTAAGYNTLPCTPDHPRNSQGLAWLQSQANITGPQSSKRESR